MTISKLIDVLKAEKSKWGDIEVKLDNGAAALQHYSVPGTTVCSAPNADGERVQTLILW